MSSSRGRQTEGSGKGDQLRKVNKDKYDYNYDLIFNKPKKEDKDAKESKKLGD